MKNSYKLLIFGDYYSIVTDESQDQVSKAAALIDSQLKEIASKISPSSVDEKRIAVLVSLQMASKVLFLESQLEQVSARHKELIDRIEHDCLALLRS